jgi:hypothetical protein
VVDLHALDEAAGQVKAVHQRAEVVDELLGREADDGGDVGDGMLVAVGEPRDEVENALELSRGGVAHVASRA